MDLKDKYRVSRPTKNRPETSTAAGITSPHIPDTNCAGPQRVTGAEKLYFCILLPELIVYNITVSFC